VFRYRPYDEARRLGLSDATEAAVRAAFPDGTGMLVVDQVIPRGPAFGKLEPGDVIVRVDGVLTTAFIPWEQVIDNKVGGTVTVELRNASGAVLETSAVNNPTLLVDYVAPTPSFSGTATVKIRVIFDSGNLADAPIYALNFIADADDDGIADEFLECGQHRFDAGCLGDHRVRDAREDGDAGSDSPSGIDQCGHGSQALAATNLDHADLGHHVAPAVTAGCLDVEHAERHIGEWLDPSELCHTPMHMMDGPTPSLSDSMMWRCDDDGH
jgi:hypothetical protein